jgi:chromosome segregation ATPase
MTKRRKNLNTSSEIKSQLGITLTPTGLDILNQMSIKEGVSKSELVERLVTRAGAIAKNDQLEEEVIEKTETSTTKEEKTVDNSALTELEAKLKSQENELRQITGELNNKNKQIENLQNQLVQQENLEKLVRETNHKINSLETELTEKNSQIKNLNNQLTTKTQPVNNTNKIQSLETELNNKNKKIEELNAKINQLENQQKQRANNLIEQFEQLQGRLTEQQKLISQYVTNNNVLKHDLEVKVHQIESLEKTVIQLQSLATIGETQLNKWRNRSY